MKYKYAPVGVGSRSLGTRYMYNSFPVPVRQWSDTLKRVLVHTSTRTPRSCTGALYTVIVVLLLVLHNLLLGGRLYLALRSTCIIPGTGNREQGTGMHFLFRYNTLYDQYDNQVGIRFDDN